MIDGLATFAPRIHRYIGRGVGTIERRLLHLRRPFPNSPYPALTVNFGPQTVCLPHVDHANSPSAFCAVAALGNFDATRGGHLVLWELKLIIEFPPGTVVLIPSSLITHSNVSVAPGETRYSFTQYAAGELFRWVENGFQTNAQLFEKMENDEERREWLDWQRATNWKDGMKIFELWH